MSQNKAKENRYIKEERKRIHQDAHDKVYNRLSAIAKRSEALATQFPNQKQKFYEISDQIRNSIAELQDIINAKYENKDIASIAFAKKEIRRICQDHALNYNQVVSFTINNGRYHLLGEKNNWHLLCILQECLNNAGKHSGADHVKVSLNERDYKVNMQVHDDGQGFYLTKLPEVLNGQGLKGIQERVKELGGCFSLKSCPQEGTCINIKVPLIKN